METPREERLARALALGAAAAAAPALAEWAFGTTQVTIAPKIHGTAFDERCVETLGEVLALEAGAVEPQASRAPAGAPVHAVAVV